MAYGVSSSFIAQSLQKAPAIVRTFTIGGSDYSARVTKWPKFKRTWDDIRPRNIQIPLANGDKGMEFLRVDKTLLTSECAISMGFVGETIALFTGKMRGVKYRDEICTLTIVDKFQQLSDRSMGTDDSPVSYEGSNYLPSDVAWWAVTSYGGFDTTVNSSNTDIDYPSFATWAAVFSGDSVLVKARFDGQKVTEVLRKIANMTHSAIFVKENKISFHRFGIADSTVSSLNASTLKDVELSFDTSDITNKQLVSGGYDVTSDYFTFTVFDAASVSVNSFGLRENVLKDVNVWYVDSSSALNLAQRKTIANADPDDSLTITTGLVGLPRQIGETLTIDDNFHSIQESYRILSHEIDMDTGLVTATIDRTQITDVFILDTTSLGSTTEVLT